MDEVEQCVLEVNAILGSPEPAAAPKDESLPLEMTVLLVQKKYLDPERDLQRLIGPTSNKNRR